MYSLLIVDDEKIERNGIKFLLKQTGIELEVHEACNGKEAIAFLEEHQVDMLLTDIKMPFIDGMELLKRVSPLYPEMKCIIFSGYSEFEYAKGAMKMGVKDYILKPVDPVEFSKTLNKVIQELEEQQISKDRAAETDSFMKEHILYSLINGMNPMEVERNVPAGCYQPQELEVYSRMILLEVSDDFFGRIGADLTNILKEIEAQQEVQYQYLNLNEQQSVWLTSSMSKEQCRSMVEQLAGLLHKRYDVTCFAAISEPMEDPVNSMGAIFDCLEERMEQKFYQTECKIFWEKEIAHDNVIAQIDDDTLMKQMKQDIKMKDIHCLRQHFNSMCEKYKGNNSFSQVYIKFIFSNLLKDFYENLPNISEQKLNDEIEELYCSKDFATVMTIINRNIDRLEQEFGRNPQMIHREIESVKTYIYENYDKEISVDYLADMVYMAPSYLSHIFKKETGQNLSKFIKAYRMERAKEMLETTHNKIVNISYAVGYPNVSYFCQSFREYFGVSPQKYRDQGE